MIMFNLMCFPDFMGGRTLQTQNAVQGWLPFLTTQMWAALVAYEVFFYDRLREKNIICQCTGQLSS